MQWLYDSAQLLTAAQTCVLPDGSAGPHCPAHALHAITAAMATQGYWVQADLLYFLEFTNFQTWAALVYILAFFGALVSMGLGAPPKMWLWLVISPGIFHWLIADTVPMKGVRWNVGPRDGGQNNAVDSVRAQREVWKLAEVGLRNTNIVKRGIVSVSSDEEPQGGSSIGVENGTVRVSQFFSYYDRLLTDLVDFAISWTGLYTMAPSNAGAGSSNLPVASMYDDTRKAGGGSIDDQNWLLSNLKWTLLEDITGAKVSSADLRDAFATFMGSECGDAFTAGVDEAAFIAAHNSKGLTVPDSIFLRTTLEGTGGASEYGILTQELISQAIPTPPSLKRFLGKGGQGSFRESIAFLKDPSALIESGMLEEIRCDQYLYLLMHAFRWESGHIYYQLVSQLPAGFNPSALHYAMMYGWAVKKDLGAGSVLADGSVLEQLLFGGEGALSRRVDLTPIESMRFFQNLVLVHLWRNEMALVPRIQVRKSSAEETVSYVQAYQKTVGAKSKFGEVYSWAMLMPRVQGVVMYFLAMAYPFCAMLILIPGWHKLLFTWASFWAWIKIWDIGFALVFAIERSMWALIGNTPETTRLFSKVLLMDDQIDTTNGSHIEITCPAGGGGLLGAFGGYFAPLPQGVCPPGTVPQVLTTGVDGGGALEAVGGLAAGVGASLGAFAGIASFESWWRSLKTMDSSLTLGASMPLDLGNSYYIYIMSALYFAVPAVTGQLVLGAKAAAAGLATNAISGLAGEGGRAAGSGFSGDLSQRARANQTAIGQAAYAKDMRSQAASGGFAARAMDQGNAKMLASAQAAFNQTANAGEGQLSKFGNHNLQSDMNAFTAGAAGIDAHFAKSGELSNAFRMNFGLPRGGPNGRVTAAPSSASSSVGAAAGGGAGSVSTTGAGGGTVGAGGNPVDAFNRAASLIDGGRQNGAAIWGINNSSAKAGWDASKAILQAQLSDGNIRQQAQHDAFQGQAGVNSFGFGQQAAGLEVSSGRNSQAADFSAKSAQYDAERNYATALGGELAAMGAGGAVSVGSKPVGMEPMAMTGQLGKAMQKKAGFAESGFQQFVKSGQDKLQGTYGYNAMISQYRPGDGAALVGRAVNGADTSWADPSQSLQGAAQQSIQKTYGADGSLKPQDVVSSQNGAPQRNPVHPNIGLIGGAK